MAEETPRFAGLLLSNLVIKDTKLGTGADANVYLAERDGTPCAAKRLHDILLEDDTPGGAERLISNFEGECVTWSKLRHPGIVQFFGVYLEDSSRLPILVMEKMDTSLRRYLEDHNKKDFPLHLKAFVLRQVAQALVYLHGQNPPLVHHDLTPNNVLLNTQSFTAKVSDFGMSRAIQPFSFSRKSSIKGTPAFMPPEALHHPPKYNESLDVFSFGNIIIATVTHDWPSPGPGTRFEGDKLVAITEFQRRENYTALFTPEEKHLFLPTVQQCLENHPDKRPTGMQLVTSLQQIEASLPNGSQFASTVAQLQQQLAAKEEECRQKDEALNEALRENNEALRENNEALRENNEALREKDEALREKDEALREKDEALREKDEALREKDEALRLTFEEVQKAFGRYDIEVEAWEGVPHAVEKLAHKQGKEPLPDALLQTATASDVLMVWKIAKVMELKSWPEVAAHLGCSSEYIISVHSGEINVRYRDGSVNEDRLHRFYDRCLIQVSADWAANKEGTGNVPRTLKTVLEAFRRCCINSEEGLANLSQFQLKLMIGTESTI